MSTTKQPQKQHDTPAQQPAAGAIIDAQGREVPITEQMIQRACRDLEQDTQQPSHSKASPG